LQVEVAAKTLGGVEFQHVVKDGPNAEAGRSRPTDAALQWRSLRALLSAVTPEALALSASLVESVLPPAFGYSKSSAADPDTDWFVGRMGDLFDPVAAAEVAAGLVFTYVLEGERATRLHYQNPQGGSDPAALPSLEAVLDETMAAAVPSAERCAGQGAEGQLELLVANLFADKLIKLRNGAHFRIERILATKAAATQERLVAQQAACAAAGAGGVAAEWGGVAEALRAGKPIIDDWLPLPAGAPI